VVVNWENHNPSSPVSTSKSLLRLCTTLPLSRSLLVSRLYHDFAPVSSPIVSNLSLGPSYPYLVCYLPALAPRPISSSSLSYPSYQAYNRLNAFSLIHYSTCYPLTVVSSYAPGGQSLSSPLCSTICAHSELLSAEI